MAPQATAGPTATLRAITFRISSTLAEKLPLQVPALSASLPHCKAILSESPNSSSKATSETSVVVHKFKTQLSTLIQHRSVQGRWAGTVLIKSTIEVGGWETLQKSGPWVRSLLAILTKPDPPTSKRLSIITLTRIFSLTWDYPTLVREITTPSLPTFIQSCLHLVSTSTSSSLVQTVLESFNQLLPRHATVFRTYLSQIQKLLAPLIAPTPSNQTAEELSPRLRIHISPEISTAARRLWVQLHYSAPKGTSQEEWRKSLVNTLENAHHVANKVFRAVIEDWQSTSGAAQMANGHTLENEVRDLELNNSMGLPFWTGIYAGSERLIALLHLVKEYANTPTHSTIYFRLDSVMDLLTRIFSLTVPASQGTKNWQQNVKLNNQVGREERESLWAVLPRIHITAIEVLHSLLERFGVSLLSTVTSMLDQLVWVYSAEKDIVGVRTALYTALTQILHLSGPTLPKSSVEPLKAIIYSCCNDLLPQDATTTQAKTAPVPTNGKAKTQQGSTNADTFLTSSTKPKTPPATFAGLQAAANDLLPVLLLKLPQKYISVSLRAKIDRTAILTRHKEAMIASVLNPPPSKNAAKPAASIMPLVARSFADSLDVESLVRPRMPVIRTGKGRSADDEEDEEEDDDEEDEENVAEKEADDSAEKHDIPVEEATDPTTPSTSANPFAQDPATIANLAKRTHTDLAPAPPSPKRPRLETPAVGEASLNDSLSTPADVSRRADPGEAFSVEKVSAPVPAPIANMAPPEPAKVGGGDSDSDDDFGELVLGPDSDDDDII
ncbi:uncharacterized protein BDZ99DRAFT_570245 [Mytilinidion resinicola]|uniref:Pre-rRNA-processing protein RIX1 n=1 Tax=Mytilinidion resinicola TaxID=574789 RepID=A0A6A6YQ02_9PEZI|nr:uncharacterized protein BDZ99DRAFT_570245 [Mytilinidion resinicola]KAF2810962.1 hypothetical protein BDZ99DRAFT_570245 [Mytilinidion resinicola]